MRRQAAAQLLPTALQPDTAAVSGGITKLEQLLEAVALLVTAMEARESNTAHLVRETLAVIHPLMNSF